MYLEALRDGVTDNRDPTAMRGSEEAQKYGGRWVAVFEPVADTEFFVMVQQRPSPSIPMSIWLAAIALLLTSLAAAILTRRYRNRRNIQKIESS